MKHFGNDHLALVTNGTCLKRLAGELLVAVAIILFYVAMRFGRRHVQELATARKDIRKIMIVALARKLLIALWQMVTTGEIPEGHPHDRRRRA